jgi:hypothetical protein
VGYGVEAKRRVQNVDLYLLVNELQVCVHGLNQEVVRLILKFVVYVRSVMSSTRFNVNSYRK